MKCLNNGKNNNVSVRQVKYSNSAEYVKRNNVEMTKGKI